jgi:amino acid adenylation domain-containing protein
MENIIASRGASPMATIAEQFTVARQRTALECGRRSLSYAELDAASARLAGVLASAGVGRGDLVAVCLPRSIGQIVALLSAWRVGAAYLPLDPEWPTARLASLVAESGSRALVAPAEQARSFAGDLPVIDPQMLPVAEPCNRADAAPEDLAYVIYTSGSTGKPKGVEVTQANLAGLIDWHAEAFGLVEGSRTSHVAGLAFDASAWEVWPTLASGGTLVLPDDDITRLEPGRLCDWLLAERIEVAFAPTAIAEPMLGIDWPADALLRFLLTGADRLKLRPRAGLPFTFVNNYGPTECTVVATSGEVSPEGADLPSIGHAIKGTEIHLLDENGEPAAHGEPGEIWIGGRQVARGYRGDPALTAERFIDDPERGRLYRTGDLGVLLDSGEIAFRGRVDAQVKVRGHRIEPAEVEAALLRLEGVAGAAVAVRGEELVAWIAPAAGKTLYAGQLRTQLAAELPVAMVPSQFAVLDALPLTPNGKVDGKALPAPCACAMPEAAELRGPSTPTEERLHAIVAEVIERADFGVDDDFFLLGGHSLLGTQVIVRARDAFGVDLTLFHLFEGRTVANLAATVEQLVFEMLDSLSDDDIRRMAAE